MKNFFKFLLVFIAVILLYVFNNPDVIDKYKTSDSSADKDSTQCVDTTVSDSQKGNVTEVDSTNMYPAVSDSINADSLVADTIK